LQYCPSKKQDNAVLLFFVIRRGMLALPAAIPLSRPQNEYSPSGFILPNRLIAGGSKGPLSRRATKQKAPSVR
jgi:hypothetical protein